MTHSVLTTVYFCCKQLTHSLFSSYNDVNIRQNKVRLPYVCYRKNNVHIVHTIAPWFCVQPLSYQLISADICHIHSYYFVKKLQNNKNTLYLFFSEAQQISTIPSTAYTLPCCWTSRHLMLYCMPSHDVKRGQRTAGGAIIQLCHISAQLTNNITYNLAAVVDIRLINRHLQIGIGRQH